MAITEAEVVLEDKADNSTSSQIWIKGPTNSDGYFTLKNKGTGKFLQGERTPMTFGKGTKNLFSQRLKSKFSSLFNMAAVGNLYTKSIWDKSQFYVSYYWVKNQKN